MRPGSFPLLSRGSPRGSFAVFEPGSHSVLQTEGRVCIWAIFPVPPAGRGWCKWELQWERETCYLLPFASLSRAPTACDQPWEDPSWPPLSLAPPQSCSSAAKVRTVHLHIQGKTALHSVTARASLPRLGKGNGSCVLLSRCRA